MQCAVQFTPSAHVLDRLLWFEMDAYLVVFRERNPDLHQSRLVVCSRYVWSNLSSTPIWCAWGASTIRSDILPEEEDTVTSQDPLELQWEDKWAPDRLCKPSRDYCHSSFLQILPYHCHALKPSPWLCPGLITRRKANGSTCLCCTHLQSPVLLPDMKEHLLCTSALFRKISGFLVSSKSELWSSLVACSII